MIAADRSRASVASPMPVHERAVDLQRVEREAAQVAERRVARAEVVEAERDAERAQVAERGLGDSASSISTLSVISSASSAGTRRAQRERDVGDDLGSCEWRAERFTHRRSGASAGTGAAGGDLPAARGAPSAPIGTIRPVSSATGMNSAGRTSPRVGWRQRTSASTADGAGGGATIGW